MKNTNSSKKRSRAESSRINGAKSHGPVTAEGKQRSCLNRTTHGMRSSRVLLHNECQDTYNNLAELFFKLFSPKDIFEHELVSNMINARWRIRRLEAASAANLDLAMEEARPDFEKKYGNIDATHEHALAYRAIAQSSGNNDIMGRHEDRQHRLFDRSYRLLARHRGKQSALPSNEDLLRAESELPPDNLPPETASTPLKKQPDIENQSFKPENKLKPIVHREEKANPKSKDQPEEPRHPLCVYEDDAKLLEPFDAAFEQYPELLIGFRNLLREFRSKNESELAA